jgi:DNA modification methylase
LSNENKNHDQQESTVEAQLLNRLGELLQDEEQDDNRWEIGDIVTQLRDSFDWTYEKLATRFAYSRARLVQIAGVAADIAAEDRNVEERVSGTVQPLPFVVYEYVRAAAKKVAREVTLHTGVEHEPNFPADLQYIAERRSAGESLTDQRAVTTALAKRARKQIDADPPQSIVLNQLRNKEYIQRCHNRPNAEVIRELADGSVKVLHLDPPYANYRRDEDGRLNMSTSTVATDCDNGSIKEAVAVTVAAIREGERKLAPNGVMLLWQASTMPKAAIAQAVDDLNLGGVPFFIWDKRRPQPSDFVEAVQYSTEVCFVLCRRGEKPLTHDPSIPKVQVISDIPPINFSAASVLQRHQMEKPLELLERLLRQFSREGDLIVDAFGCTGSCCVAAERLRRKWIYCESHPANFAIGSANIMAAMIQRQKEDEERKSA